MTMTAKYCKHCDTEHELLPEFWHRLDGSPRCKARIKDYKKSIYDPAKQKIKNTEYRSKNPEFCKKINAKWRADNAEYNRERARSYYYENKDRVLKRANEYKKSRRKTDISFRLACNLRGRLYRALKGLRKGGSAVQDLGCSVEELKLHLEQQFEPGMTWENYGTLWHVDHIMALANYDLEDRGTYCRLVHYTNLQPLLADTNRRKKNNEEGLELSNSATNN